MNQRLNKERNDYARNNVFLMQAFKNDKEMDDISCRRMLLRSYGNYLFDDSCTEF